MGYVLFFNLRAGVMDSVIWDTFSILCVNINNEATLDRMDESKSPSEIIMSSGRAFAT